MPDYNHIYNHQADLYAQLVAYEDYEHNLLPTLNAIVPAAGRDVIESGAGTGRLTALLAPHVYSLRAFDLSPAMLGEAARLCHEARNTHFAVADHRALPAPDASADLVLSGWSVCMLVVNYRETWQTQVAQTLREFERVLRPGGTIIIIETKGTGHETPVDYPNLADYYTFLKTQGFESTWIRTDFQFDDEAQAEALTGFFFGEKFAKDIVAQYGVIVPECTGVWWKRL
ncbi:MAG TPA: class I SAM-dependent methyltransferase [Anaerolineae bacterium]|nr:class I SAM-dependent methyltransferase [Anaerolineae bacterium]